MTYKPLTAPLLERGPLPYSRHRYQILYPSVQPPAFQHQPYLYSNHPHSPRHRHSMGSRYLISRHISMPTHERRMGTDTRSPPLR